MTRAGRGLVEMIEEHVPDEEVLDGLVDEKLHGTALGILRDVLFGARLSTETVFGVLSCSARFCFEGSRRLLGLPGCEIGQKAVHKFQRLIEAGIEGSETAVVSVILLLDELLAERGESHGDLLRVLVRDQDYRHALLCIVRLLGKLGNDLKTKNPVRLVSALRTMIEAQHLAKENRIKERSEKLSMSFVPLINYKSIRKWDRLMHFCAASYGHSMLRLQGLISRNAPVSSLEETIMLMSGVDRDDIVYSSAGTGKVYDPSHFVCVDHETEAILVVIRGTMHLADLLIDLVCESVMFKVSSMDGDDGFQLQVNGEQDAEEEEKQEIDCKTFLEGRAHRGFLIAAKRMARELHDIVDDALAEFPDYRLVVTGHSMGGGIATLLTLLWAHADAFPDSDLHCFAFGAPCSLCKDLAQSSFVKKRVTSLVVGDDFVSRLSFSTVSEVNRAIWLFDGAGLDLTDEEKRNIYESFERDLPENKLFAAGTCWLLDAEEFNHNPVEIDPRDLLHALEFSDTFLTAHLPLRYLRAISNADHFSTPKSTQALEEENPQEALVH